MLNRFVELKNTGQLVTPDDCARRIVDFIVEMAQVTEKSVTPEELNRDPDEKKPAAAKKASGKAAAKKPAEKDSSEKKPAAGKSKTEGKK